MTKKDLTSMALVMAQCFCVHFFEVRSVSSCKIKIVKKIKKVVYV
nr:MAG TPA: hypothetical protein [Caudoviricetes sp.]